MDTAQTVISEIKKQVSYGSPSTAKLNEHNMSAPTQSTDNTRSITLGKLNQWNPDTETGA